MRTTIDEARRMLIPTEIRDRLGLRAGTPVEVVLEEGSIHLTRAAPGPEIVQRGPRRVARPTLAEAERQPVDLPAWIEQERDRQPTG